MGQPFNRKHLFSETNQMKRLEFAKTYVKGLHLPEVFKTYFSNESKFSVFVTDKRTVWLKPSTSLYIKNLKSIVKCCLYNDVRMHVF